MKKILAIFLMSVVSLIIVLFIYADKKIQKHVELRETVVKENSGEYNLRLLGEYLINYTSINDGKLPLATSWCDSLIDFSSDINKENFQHPKKNELSLGECNFAFNKKLSGLSLDSISPDTILIFEADGEWNLNGTGELLQSRYSKNGYISVLYVNQEMRNYWFYKDSWDWRNKSHIYFFNTDYSFWIY